MLDQEESVWLRKTPRHSGFAMPAVFSLSSTLEAGVSDSLAPGALAAQVIFFSLLIFAAYHGRRTLTLGIVFILAVIFTRVFIVMGLLDVLLLSDGFFSFLDVVYFIFAVACLGAGAVFWRDWWRLRRTGDAGRLIVTPGRIRRLWDRRLQAGAGNRTDPASPEKVGRRWVSSLMLMVAAGLGIFVAFIENAWGPHAYVVVTVTNLLTGTNLQDVFMLLLFYSCAYVIPLVLVLAVSEGLLRSRRSLEILAEKLSLSLVVCSAVFVAFGVSFLSYYF